MTDQRVRTRSRDRMGACVLLVVAVFAFWKIRIIDLGTNPAIEVGPIDLYVEHTPMAQFGYEELAAGRLPLWNPYQFCGQPFLAVPHVALLYPLHAFSLFVDAPKAVEVSFLLHMFLGGIGMWLLARRLGLESLAALSASLTFIWSGWIVFANVVPGTFASLNWLPVTILLIDRAIDRSRFAITLLVVAITSQFLLGATEVLLHTGYVAAGFSACRLAQLARAGRADEATRRGIALVVALVVSLFFSAPQLLPSIEFVAQSGRGAGAMSLAEAASGAIGPLDFLRSALATTGLVSVGILPFLALPLGFADRRHRSVWLFAGLAASLAALLVFGGLIYQAYYSIPLIGPLFRRPVKFLDIYAFGQALFAGLAIAHLHAMATWPRPVLWKNARWLACIGLVASAAIWTFVCVDPPTPYWIACLALLLVYGALPRAQWRRILLVSLLVLQAASLFFQVGGTHVRPSARPETFNTRDDLLRTVRAAAGHDRVHVSSLFIADPGLTAKQGLLKRLKVSGDYETLAAVRYARFFEAVTSDDRTPRINPFAGMYRLFPDSRWKLMDLTATRYFVMTPREPAAAYMRSHPSEFRRVAADRSVQVFERSIALPRAYLVASARVLEGAEAVLETLSSADFDPRAEVLFEEPLSFVTAAGHPIRDGRVAFQIDEPERVVLDVSTSDPAFLVLSDLDYPGWRAFVNDREVEIERANYLFRAVAVEAGDSRIRFEYRPDSFRIGLLLSGMTLFVVVSVVVGVFAWRRWRPAG